MVVHIAFNNSNFSRTSCVSNQYYWSVYCISTETISGHVMNGWGSSPLPSAPKADALPVYHRIDE